MEYFVKSPINTRGILPILSIILIRAIRLTKHLVDQVSADYIGFTCKDLVSWTNMVFLCCLSERTFDVVRRVFKFLHKIYHFKPIFTLKL